MGGQRVTEGTEGTQGAGMRMAWKDASAVATDVMAMLGPHVERVAVAGSIRRLRESCGDVDIVAIPRGEVKVEVEAEAGRGRGAARMRIGQIMREMCVDLKTFRGGEKMISAVVGHGRYGLCGPGGRQEREAQVDVYFATPENFGMLLCVRTGSAQHNIYMAKLAQRMGMKFAAGTGVEPAGVNHKDTKTQRVAEGRTEESVFGAFGLLVPEPRDREIVRGIPIWMEKASVRKG